MSATLPPAPPVEDKPLPIDPGRARTLAHYTAMLDELKAEQEKKKPACRPAS